MHVVQGSDALGQHSLSYFQSASTFGALSEDTLLWLFQEGTVYALEKGEVLFEPDERGDAFFVILEGEIAYYKCHEGKYAHIRDYKRGEQIGFMSMIALHDRVGTAVSLSDDTLVLEVNSELFHSLHESAPLDFGLLMMNLAREMARSLRKADDNAAQRACSDST